MLTFQEPVMNIADHLCKDAGLIHSLITLNRNNNHVVVECLVSREEVYKNKIDPVTVHLPKAIAFMNYFWFRPGDNFQVLEAPHRTPSAHWVFKICNYDPQAK